MRATIRRIVESEGFKGAIIALILVNAFVLGILALPEVASGYGVWLHDLDWIIIWLFVAEIGLRIFAHGRAFFRDPWSVFDLAVVSVALMPASGAFSALRAFRILRVLRLISAFQSLRRVVSALLIAVPGITSVGIVLVIILYVAAIIATNLFGSAFPDMFGNLWVSMFTLFKVMTLEGWPDIADEVLAVYPYAWIFFVVYIMVGTLTLLNLLIAIIVNAMEAEARDERKEMLETDRKLLETDREMEADLDALRAQMDLVLARLSARDQQSGGGK